MSNARLFPLVAWSAIGIAILLGLGTWQLLRLEAKSTYLQLLEERVKAEPVPLAEALRRNEAGEDIEFLKVTATGNWSGANLYKQATFDGGPGWVMLAPFRSLDGIALLVDRGTIPDALRSEKPAADPAQITVIGVVRKHDNGRGFFDPDNDASAGSWYWWDVPAMLAATQIAPTDKVATFILQQLPVQGAPKFPVAEDLATGIPNNHFQYALTWYALALCLAAIAVLRARALKS